VIGVITLLHITVWVDTQIKRERSTSLLTLRPYDGKWSKSMVGYGPEDEHFVVELTYNYGIKQYKKGNDFQVSKIYKRQALLLLKFGPDKCSRLCGRLYGLGYPFVACWLTL